MRPSFPYARLWGKNAESNLEGIQFLLKSRQLQKVDLNELIPGLCQMWSPVRRFLRRTLEELNRSGEKYILLSGLHTISTIFIIKNTFIDRNYILMFNSMFNLIAVNGNPSYKAFYTRATAASAAPLWPLNSMRLDSATQGWVYKHDWTRTLCYCLC